MRVAIVGTGVQCRRRAPVIQAWPDTSLVAVTSRQPAHSEAMARQLGCEFSKTWQEVVSRDDVDTVLVCTPPHVHAEITTAALRAGKHVLCEKPLCRTMDEAGQMLTVAHQTGRTLKCGFNHRHHPAIWEARQLLDRGEIGKPIFARCQYGICGRPGFEKEWRADPSQAAGGQFIEQGSHAIDLLRWFLGEITEVACMLPPRYFTKQMLEDNGMAIFRMASGATASLHTSFTEWKNRFIFEVFGEDGYVKADGLGGSYGTETLTIGRRDFDAPFQNRVIEYRGGDISWREEWREFVNAIQQQREPLGSGLDGAAAMQIALAAYDAEKQGKVIKLLPVQVGRQ